MIRSHFGLDQNPFSRQAAQCAEDLSGTSARDHRIGTDKHLPAVISNALDLSEIVHPRTRPPETRPPLANRATTSPSNASTRGDRGLGVGVRALTLWL
jgi:hypothetical protein